MPPPLDYQMGQAYGDPREPYILYSCYMAADRRLESSSSSLASSSIHGLIRRKAWDACG